MFYPETGKYFREVYDFQRLVKVRENNRHLKKYNENSGRKRKRLRIPLNIGENVLVLAERLKKKDAPGIVYKSTTENKSFFNRDKIFTVNAVVKLDNGTYLYWLKEGDRKVKGRFLRQELFALNEQFRR